VVLESDHAVHPHPRRSAPSHHASFAPASPWHSPPVCSSELGTCGVSLDRCLDISLTAAASYPSLQNHSVLRSRSLARELLAAHTPHSTPSVSWGFPSRGGLALPVSLCGCSSIPVRGGSRIASLHQSNVVSSSTLAAIFSASLLAASQLSNGIQTSRAIIVLSCAFPGHLVNLSQNLHLKLPGSTMAP
jgi:hypothetical protein